MIEFPVEALKEIGAAAETEHSYWQALFSSPGRLRVVDAGVVAVVLNAALENGIVRLPVGNDTPDYNKGQGLDLYYIGWAQGRVGTRNASSPNGSTITQTDVHGPTGAAIERLGVVTFKGDGTASFDHEGEQVAFRITLDDDESNADRYYRGFNDGVEFVRSGEADAVIRAAQAEAERELSENDPEVEAGYDSTDHDDDEIGAVAPPKSDEKLTEVYDRLTANGGPLTNAQADVYNKLNGVAGWRPGEEFGDPLPSAPSPQAAATLGPEHTIVTPLRNPIGRERKWPPPKLPDPDTARSRLAAALSQGSGGALVQAVSKPKTLEEADALGGELSEIIAAIQATSDAGRMPTIKEYNRDRPEHLPAWQAIMSRHEIASWDQMAAMCGLDLNERSARLMTPARRDQLEKLKAQRRAEPDSAAAGRGGYYQPALDQVIAELQRQASGTGDMPTKDTYDAARPATWAKAMATLQRFDLSWEQLAEKAGLKQRQRGPQPQTA